MDQLLILIPTSISQNLTSNSQIFLKYVNNLIKS